MARPALLEDSGIYSGRVSPWLTAPAGDNQRTWGYPSKPQVTDIKIERMHIKVRFFKGTRTIHISG